MKTIIFLSSAILFSAIASAQTTVSSEQMTRTNTSVQKGKVDAKASGSTSINANTTIPNPEPVKQDNKTGGAASLKGESLTKADARSNAGQITAEQSGTVNSNVKAVKSDVKKTARVKSGANVNSNISTNIQPHSINTAGAIGSGIKIGL